MHDAGEESPNHATRIWRSAQECRNGSKTTKNVRAKQPWLVGFARQTQNRGSLEPENYKTPVDPSSWFSSSWHTGSAAKAARNLSPFGGRSGKLTHTCPWHVRGMSPHQSTSDWSRRPPRHGFRPRRVCLNIFPYIVNTVLQIAGGYCWKIMPWEFCEHTTTAREVRAINLVWIIQPLKISGFVVIRKGAISTAQGILWEKENRHFVNYRNIANK